MLRRIDGESDINFKPSSPDLELIFIECCVSHVKKQHVAMCLEWEEATDAGGLRAILWACMRRSSTAWRR